MKLTKSDLIEIYKEAFKAAIKEATKELIKEGAFPSGMQAGTGNAPSLMNEELKNRASGIAGTIKGPEEYRKAMKNILEEKAMQAPGLLAKDPESGVFSPGSSLEAEAAENRIKKLTGGNAEKWAQMALTKPK